MRGAWCGTDFGLGVRFSELPIDQELQQIVVGVSGTGRGTQTELARKRKALLDALPVRTARRAHWFLMAMGVDGAVELRGATARRSAAYPALVAGSTVTS